MGRIPSIGALSPNGVQPREEARVNRSNQRLLKDGFFWAIAVMAFSSALLCYAPQLGESVSLTGWGAVVTNYYLPPAYRLLFLISVSVAAWRFGTRGGVVTCIAVGPVILSKIAVNFPLPDAWVDFVVVAVSAQFAGIAGREGSLRRRLERAAAELEHQSKTLKREIAERKQSEEALLLKNALLKAQSEATIDGILAVNEKREIVLFNARLQEMWRIPGGLLEEKMDDLVFRHILSQTNDPQSVETWGADLFSRESEKGRFEVKLADGRVFDVFSSPLVDEGGVNRGRVWYFRDVTERKDMTHRLMMTDRLASIGELVSGIAHELNNPLTGVIGFSQLVMQKEISDDVRSDLSIISGEAQRAAHIVKDLLTFARKHVPVKVPSQVNSIVEDVLRLRVHEHKLHNIEVVLQLSPDLPEIMVDYHQMQQVFFNIVINAEYFMLEAHDRGRLTVTTGKDGGFVRTTFTDDGFGIPEENLNHVFDPFFTTKETGKGTGLGLSICHGIVTEHGGRIYARSERGKGATFVVELPVETDDPSSLASPLASDKDGVLLRPS